MNEPTFHRVSWAPSAIKDAVEHATEAFKAADGAFARVSTFELSALIDATRALIEHNEREDVTPDYAGLRERLARCWDGDDDPSDESWREEQADRALAVVTPELERRDAELALAQERIAKTRQALQLDEKWSVQHGALAVRGERDKAVAERDALRAQLAEAVDLLDSTIDEDPCQLDHNQNCQAHSWFDWGKSECNNARIKRFVGAHDEAAPVSESVPATSEPCVCNGGWTVDENYQPEDYERNEPLRPEKGLIPCGFCNHGGWDAPWPPAPSGVVPPEVEAAPSCTVCGEPRWNNTDRCNLHAPIKGNVEVRRGPAAASADTTPRAWSGPDPEEDRKLLIEAVRYVLHSGNARTTALQRRLRVGFAKAWRLTDLLEAWGVVSPRFDRKDERVVLAPSGAVDDIVAAISEVLPDTEQDTKR